GGCPPSCVAPAGGGEEPQRANDLAQVLDGTRRALLQPADLDDVPRHAPTARLRGRGQLGKDLLVAGPEVDGVRELVPLVPEVERQVEGAAVVLRHEEERHPAVPRLQAAERLLPHGSGVVRQRQLQRVVVQPGMQELWAARQRTATQETRLEQSERQSGSLQEDVGIDAPPLL